MLARLREGDAREVLYALLLEALGYSRNRGAMLRLARGLPLGKLRSLLGNRPDPLSLEALLLGAAGLLPHQRGLLLLTPEGAGRAAELSAQWRSAGTPRRGGSRRLGPHGATPAEQPAAQAGRRRSYSGPPLAGRAGASASQTLGGVLSWGHSTGVPSAERGVLGPHTWTSTDPRTGPPRSWARARAGEMMVNVLLPWLFATAHLTGDAELRRRALQLFHGARPCPDNEVTREVKALMAASKGDCPVVNSARRQQGLIHVYRVLQGRAGGRPQDARLV